VDADEGGTVTGITNNINCADSTLLEAFPTEGYKFLH